MDFDPVFFPVQCKHGFVFPSRVQILRLQVITHRVEDHGGVLGRIPLVAAFGAGEKVESPRDQFMIRIMSRKCLEHGSGDFKSIITPAGKIGGGPVRLITAASLGPINEKLLKSIREIFTPAPLPEMENGCFSLPILGR